MPLVIPKGGPVVYVRTQEILSELLGHVNFDGEPWAIGDRLIFEDGTESRIEQVPGEQFYDWPDAVPADFEEVKRAAGFANAENWQGLFRHFETQGKGSGCAAIVVLFAVAAAASAAV